MEELRNLPQAPTPEQLYEGIEDSEIPSIVVTSQLDTMDKDLSDSDGYDNDGGMEYFDASETVDPQDNVKSDVKEDGQDDDMKTKNGRDKNLAKKSEMACDDEDDESLLISSDEDDDVKVTLGAPSQKELYGDNVEMDGFKAREDEGGSTWPLPGSSSPQSLGKHNPVFIPDTMEARDDNNKGGWGDEQGDAGSNPDQPPILIQEQDQEQEKTGVTFGGTIFFPSAEVAFEEEIKDPKVAMSYEEIYAAKKAAESKTHEMKISRRQDWLAFEDYDDSDSDAAEILSKIPGGEPTNKSKVEPEYDFGYICCPCSTWCVERKLNKVSPEHTETATDALKRHIDLTRSMEVAPPEADAPLVRGDNIAMIPITGDVLDQHLGRRLFFDDGIRRIDHVLVWRVDGKDPEKAAERDVCRKVFERNLEEEGLEIEHDVQDGRELQYLKIHAPWEVLSRYAEIMKLRMPIKEVPEEIATTSIWELLTDFTSKLMSPFELNPLQVPPMPKKFTYVFERDKEYLFAIPDRKELFFSHAQRSRIVDYILRRKKYSDEETDTFAFGKSIKQDTEDGIGNKNLRDDAQANKFWKAGIKRLLASKIYDSAYPLHEGSWKPWTKPSMRRLLYEHWANWKNFYKLQPLDYIRVYFGEKIGLYFAWLGFYTYFLIPASIVGLIVFIYGVWIINSDIVGQETCEGDFLMCPKCDLRCPYWNYSSVCRHVRASLMFDNGATVFFAIFMSLWGTIFLEFWKREQACIQFKWNLMNFQEEEEPPRPEYLIKLASSKFRKRHRVSGVEEPFVPFWRRRVPIMISSYSVMIFLSLIALSVVLGVIVYRMAILAALYATEEVLVYRNAAMITSATAACINLVCIFILNYIYEYVAIMLTDWECLRTQTEYDSSLTFKLYTLQFVNYYSSIVYIAFFKGRFTGRPGDYNTLFGARQEECSGGGCLIELCIQLAIIFVGKMLIQNNLMEIFIPRLKKCLKTTFACMGAKDLDEKQRENLMPWEKDYILEELGTRGLFNEYLEMLIQFGFVTIFVAAFPLAPLFALLNNIIEIRADADKFVTQLRRPMAARAETIGVWYKVLFLVSRLSILTNAFIIAFTSSFIHRLVYKNVYSADGSLHGYVNNSLSYFNVSDFAENNKPIDNEGKFNETEICRYRDYRAPPWDDDKYIYTTQFWHVCAAQFIFIVIFENVVILITNAIESLIPDMPRKLREQVRRENYLTNEIILKTELKIAKGSGDKIDDDEMGSIRRRIQANIFAFGKNVKKDDVDANVMGMAEAGEVRLEPEVEVRRGGGGATGGGGAPMGQVRGSTGDWNGSTTLMNSRDNVFDESNV